MKFDVRRSFIPDHDSSTWNRLFKEGTIVSPILNQAVNDPRDPDLRRKA